MQVNSRKLIAMRKKIRWTQDDLALASGLSTRTIQRAESSGYCSLETLKAICSAFNVDPDTFGIYKIDRSWMVGPVIGMLGGATGCGFGYWAIYMSATKTNVGLSNYLIMLSFVSVMLMFSILYPGYVIYKNWNATYDYPSGKFISE